MAQGGESLFGLTKASVRAFIERQPDAGGCASYQFWMIPRAKSSTPRMNTTGCLRSEPCTKVCRSLTTPDVNVNHARPRH